MKMVFNEYVAELASKYLFYLADFIYNASDSRGIERLTNLVESVGKSVDPNAYWVHEVRKKRAIRRLSPEKLRARIKEIFGDMPREEGHELLRQD